MATTVGQWRALAAAVVVAGFGLGAPAARADGSSMKDEPVIAMPTVNWTGLYVGGGVGAGAIVHDLGVTIDDFAALGFDGIGGEGIFGTLQVGADLQLHNRFVIGAFFDYDFGGPETDLSATWDLGYTYGSLGATLEVERMWSLGARIGMLTSPTTLIYVGAAYAHMETNDPALTISADGDPPYVVGALAMPDFSGYSLLVGMETMLRDRLSLKIEYRFTQFDAETLYRDCCGNIVVDTEPSMHTARLVAAYRFNLDAHRAADQPLK